MVYLYILPGSCRGSFPDGTVSNSHYASFELQFANTVRTVFRNVFGVPIKAKIKSSSVLNFTDYFPSSFDWAKQSALVESIFAGKFQMLVDKKEIVLKAAFLPRQGKELFPKLVIRCAFRDLISPKTPERKIKRSENS